MAAPRSVPGLAPMTERALAREIARLAALFGYERYHTHRSDFSPAGFPDECLIRPPRIVFAELKSDVAYRRPGRGLSAAQQHWIDLLDACPGAEVYVWAPQHLDEIVKTLR